MFIWMQKNRLHLSRVSRNNAKILWACYFGYFGHALLHTPEVILLICRKLLCTQNISFIPDIFLEILQRCANFLFWILWACLATHTLKYHFVENFHVYLYAKKTLPFTSFLRYYILKIPAIWLAHISRTKIFPDLGLVVKYK